MTRQEEWEIQEARTAEDSAPKQTEPSGVHKLNTHDRGVYGGFTKAAVVRLLQKKKGYQYSQSEETALKAYFNERLANMECSMSAGTPDYLLYEGTGGVLLDAADKKFVTDEKKCFDRDRYKRVLPLLPGESPASNFVCADEAEAALAAWTVSVPVNVMTSDQLASELARTVYLQFADSKPAKRRAADKSKRQEHEDQGGAA
jgi:hypothetical protein